VALSDYNGFTGKYREQVGRRMEKSWKEHPHLRPTECAVCFQTEGAIHGHNEDYSAENVYLPLCLACHVILHMRWNSPQLWEDYKLAVRHGFQGPPLQQNNGLRLVKSTYPVEMRKDERYIWEERTATVLDMLSPIKFTHPNAAKCDMGPPAPAPSTNVTPIRRETPFALP
jgi:hypothetical protein